MTRLAIVHDALINKGGAERVAYYIHKTFPDAHFYTSAYFPDKTFEEFKAVKIRTLSGAGLVSTERQCKRLFPLWLYGFRTLDLSNYDCVLSSTTWGAKFIRTKGRHISYCHAPFRFLWNQEAYSKESLPYGNILAGAAKQLLSRLRDYDLRTMQSIDQVITNCKNVARQISDVYQRDADVVFAPISVADYTIGAGPGDYYLSVGRLMSHKAVGIAIRACEKLRRNLIVVGDGPERSRLEILAGKTCEFVGQVSQSELRRLYAGCRALIFPSHEDFGLVPLEAQASGRPVIAFGKGGALETVVEPQSGVFFREQTVESLIQAIEKFETMKFNPQEIRAHSYRFDVSRFSAALRQYVTGL